MADLAAGLLNRIRASFRARLSEDAEIQAVYRKITQSDASYADAGSYAALVGQALSGAFLDNLGALPDGKLYYNIANRVIRPMLEEDHTVVSDAAAAVQKHLNEKAGISIKPQKAPVNQDRIDGIVEKVSSDEFEAVRWVLQEPVVNFSMNVVDEIIKANADFHYRAGLTPKIIRKAEAGACKWCRALAGEYDYPDVPKDVYRRHENCRCTVEYDPGGSKRRQNVHTKRWTTEEETARIEARKQTGIKTLAENLAEHPKRLASFTPASLKEQLEKEGMEVKPLKQGSLKNISFEDGGGYKVNFPDGGILQYHPEKGSHHNGAYYKISTGKGGTHRYELDGTEQHK